MNTERESSHYEAEYRALIDGRLSLQLATCNAGGEAEISYAPFIHLQDSFYIYVSNLAKHTANMLASRQAAIMLIQPEAEASNPFARQRLMFNCRVAEITQDDDGLFSHVLDAMHKRFGEVVGVLRVLPDFHLLALKPQQGQYISGFGKAFKLNMDTGGLLPVGG